MHPLPPSLLPLRSFTKCSAPTRSQSPSRHVLMPLLVKIRPARSLACLPRVPARFGYSLESARARELAQCGHKLQWAGIGTSSVTAGMGTRPVSACALAQGWAFTQCMAWVAHALNPVLNLSLSGCSSQYLLTPTYAYSALSRIQQ